MKRIFYKIQCRSLNILILHALFLLLFIGARYSSSAIYYIDSIEGNDEHKGISPDSAWKSLEKISSMVFQPGDSILFRANRTWFGQLYPKGSGSGQNPIIINRYGTGHKPVLDAQGKSYAIRLSNQEYWDIKNLEITNFNENDPNSYKRGVWIHAEDYGTVHHINLINLIIHDINSSLEPGDASKSKQYGGIHFEITGSSVPTYFNGILMEGCHIYDVDRTGISLKSSWETRTLTTNTNWIPSRNVVIRNNIIERTGGNGIIWRVSHKPLVEYNIFCECATKLSGNAMFFFNCDSAIAQYNESYLTVYNPGDNDAGGFDADYRCKGSLFQYNYSHDNGKAFMVVTCQGGSTRFNDGTIVRYNISQNDKSEVFRISGQTTNTKIYNNTIYLAHEMSTRVIYHKSWKAWPDDTEYYNNIFYNLGSGGYSFGSSTNNVFDHNVFYGSHPNEEPNDSHQIIDNPKFDFPGSGGTGINTVHGYQLQPDSPCINSGLIIPDYGSRDYWGNPVPDMSGVPDRGTHEYQQDTGIFDVTEMNNPQYYHLYPNYPNPFNQETHITIELKKDMAVYAFIYDTRGKKLRSLFREYLQAGTHSILWNGRNDLGESLPSGLYFTRIDAKGQIRTIKMLLIR